MARYFSSAKMISFTLADGLSVAMNRSFSAAAPVSNALVKGAVRSGMVKQTEQKVAETSPWVPDPVTGYYRPENHRAEIDVAELRQVLLKQRIR